MTTFEQQQLAQRVLDHIEANPKQHNQDSWGVKHDECGTQACIAGWVTLLSEQAYFQRCECSYCKSSGCNEWVFKTIDGSKIVSEVAQELLGLSYEDAERLFFYTSDNSKAVEAVRYLANGKNIDFDKIGIPERPRD